MIEPKQLPFDIDSFKDSDDISVETIDTHYNKHYKAYINNLNKLIQGTVYEKMPLEDIVMQSGGPIQNNSAQAFNHEFYFNCITTAKTAPSDEVIEAINNTFNSLEDLQKDFTKTSKRLFGSGWSWLVWDTYDSALDILILENAGTPLNQNEIRTDEMYIPLLCCDMWEHSWYLDYASDKGSYLDSFWNIVNWEFVNNNFSKIK